MKNTQKPEPKPKLFAELRIELQRKGFTQKTIALYIDRSYAYVNQRFRGMKGKYWTQEDMYAFMDVLGLPHDQLHLYFPKNGKVQKPRSRAA